MTNEEFSNQLDTLLNSYNIQAGFGEGSNKQGGIALDEYEKSVFLTKAQYEIVKSYFSPKGNKFNEGFPLMQAYGDAKTVRKQIIECISKNKRGYS